MEEQRRNHSLPDPFRPAIVPNLLPPPPLDGPRPDPPFPPNHPPPPPSLLPPPEETDGDGACVHDEGSVNGEMSVSTNRRARVRVSWVASWMSRRGERVVLLCAGAGFGCESVGDILVDWVARGQGEREVN